MIYYQTLQWTGQRGTFQGFEGEHRKTLIYFLGFPGDILIFFGVFVCIFSLFFEYKPNGGTLELPSRAVSRFGEAL